MAGLGAPEIIIIAIVIFALFGYKKLPDAARSVGRSMRIFKAETKGMQEDNVQAKAQAEHVRSPIEGTPVPPVVVPPPAQAPTQAPSSTPTSDSR
ncbi:MAG TPA: Sec-independent protein translocase subunit TatA [Mycobacteriales bacterium]|nr:Sec-independent protein translocase subunit TatA [Mycobacteriales bacterium]